MIDAIVQLRRQHCVNKKNICTKFPDYLYLRLKGSLQLYGLLVCVPDATFLFYLIYKRSLNSLTRKVSFIFKRLAKAVMLMGLSQGHKKVDVRLEHANSHSGFRHITTKLG